MVYDIVLLTCILFSKHPCEAGEAKRERLAQGHSASCDASMEIWTHFSQICASLALFHYIVKIKQVINVPLALVAITPDWHWFKFKPPLKYKFN